MEPHPVPQNIIDVEFKLFGSFTLSQFSKILVGGLVAIFLFFLNINPLIKLPLVLLSVLLGFGMAVLPNLGVWIRGLLKAIFVSPRYVWQKQPVVPDLLLPTQQNNIENKTNREYEAVKAKGRLRIDEIPLTTSAFANSNSNDDEFISDNEDFFAVYKDVFGNDIINTNKETPISNTLTSEESNSVSEKPGGFASQFLSRAVQVIDVNILKKTTNPNKNPSSKQALEIPREIPGQVINGIVVDRSGNAISNAEIFLNNLSINKTFKTLAGADGRFSSFIPIPQGDYEVKVVKSGLRFNSYKITIGSDRLPAYKLREKV